MRYLTTKNAIEVLKLIEENDLFLGIICDALWQTGRRIGELLSLTKSKCDVRENEVSLTFYKEKTRQRMNRHRSTVTVIISRETWDNWQEKMSTLGCFKGRTYIFSRKKYNQELYVTLVKKYSRLLNKLKNENSCIEEMLSQNNNKFHTWRHSYAYALKHEMNYDLDSLKDAMGHESITTTKEFYGDWFFHPSRRFLDRRALEKGYSLRATHNP